MKLIKGTKETQPEAPLFESSENALKFLFNYSLTQSPTKSTWQDLARNYDDYYHIGQGKGLHGLDAAAQAGMIANKLDRLPDEQVWIIVVKFCTGQVTCSKCGQDGPMEEWEDAVEYLSQCVELEGIPRRIRHKMVQKAICGGMKLPFDQLANRYSLSERTLYRQQASIKAKFSKLYKQALINLDVRLTEDERLVA